MNAYHTIILLLPLIWVCSGCLDAMAARAVTAPNTGLSVGWLGTPNAMEKAMFGFDKTLRLDVGEPEVSLCIYQFDSPKGYPVKGTVVMASGYLSPGLTIAHHAKTLSQAGYRVFLIDLRGCGRSTGDHLTFGMRESEDLSQVIDQLADRQLIVGPLAAYGLSYGAATMIQLAGQDRRIDAVVAIAGFAEAKDAAIGICRGYLPGGRLFSQKEMDDALDTMNQTAKFDIRQVSPARAIGRTHASVLLIHGESDCIVSYEQARKLKAAGGTRCQLIHLPWHGHLSIGLDADQSIRRQAIEWLNRHLPGNDTRPS